MKAYLFNNLNKVEFCYEALKELSKECEFGPRTETHPFPSYISSVGTRVIGEKTWTFFKGQKQSYQIIGCSFEGGSFQVAISEDEYNGQLVIESELQSSNEALKFVELSIPYDVVLKVATARKYYY